MNEILRDIVIIGTGSAGLTAGIYAARANLQPLILEGLQPGGQLTITTDVENYPGFSDIVQGPWLMDQMKAQALNVGAEIINELVTSVDFSDKLKIIKCDSGKIIKAKSVVICTGAQARWLGIESEKKFNGRGVSACATCDGFFYRNKNVAVIGGGNTKQIGKFPDSISVLKTGLLQKHGITKVGVAGHPEGSNDISDEKLKIALLEKNEFSKLRKINVYEKVLLM